MDNDIDKSLVFINSPIDSISDDIIGFSAHADKLQAAIASGAKMIAVTSPFGSGKSSLSKILEKNLEKHSEYQCIRLSLWPQLLSSKNKSNESETNTYEATDLHRYFLYQVVSKINPRHATYVGKKLNGNYGLWKLHIDGVGGTLLIILAAILFIASFIIGKFMDADTELLKWSAKAVSDFFLIVSIAFFVISIWRSEILFSSRKSEGQRITTSTDIIELFKKYILNHNAVDHYVIIIEDLDRTDNNDLVVTFLKELRKYYIEDENGKITFIVNIKPESFIHKRLAEHEQGSFETLYSKLFDYTLNLQSINIMDYDAILSSLLQQKEEQIKALLNVKSVSLDDTPEFEWIIRGNELSIRTIKERLNRTFALYESLKKRFANSPVDFKKCAAASYLTTAYEKDFYSTDHEAFGLLSEALIRNDLDSQIETLLLDCSDEYKSAVKELVQAHLIDDEYHKYYYNYPQDGRIYYSDELVVRSAILFGTAPDNLIQMTERSLARGSSIFEESFARLMRLGILIPDAVMENELLYIEALRYYSEGVYEWIRNLDYKEESTPVTVKKILNLLSFDTNRSVYSSIHAKKYSEI